MATREAASRVEAMRAVVRRGRGRLEDVLRIEEVGKPTLEDDSVLVRVRAAGIARADWYTITSPALIMRPMTALMGPVGLGSVALRVTSQVACF
jgi:NADPH:quinone reductase-like Zn-dependent oxidoreductase